MAINAGTVFINVAANVGPFRQQMLGLGSQLSQVGHQLSTIGVGLSRAVTLPLGLAGAAAVKLAVDYDSAFTRIAAITNQSQENIAKWREELLTLGGATGRAPQELAEALYIVSSAGLDVSQIMPVMEASAKAAATGLGEVRVVAQLTANAVNAYSASGLKASEVTDTLVAAVREGTAQPEEFANAMGRILPIASKAGVEFQNVAASLAVVSNIGLDVNEGVTAMRGLLKALLVPGTQAADTLRDIGLTATEVRDQLAEEGLLGVVRTLEEETKKEFGKGWLDALNKIVPNIRAVTGALGLTTQEAEKVDAIFRRVAASTGATDKAFEEIKKSAQFQFQQMLAQLKAVGIELGNEILPILIEAGRTVTDLVKGFNELPEATQEWIVKMGALAFVAGPVLRILGGMVGAVAALGKGFTFLAGLGPRIFAFFTGVKAASTAAAGATAAASTAAGGAGAAGATGLLAQLIKVPQALAGAGIIAGVISVVNDVMDDLAVTEGELARQTGITTHNLGELYAQLNRGAYSLNIFGSREDQARKAGEIFNDILQDMTASGISQGRALDMLNEVFADSVGEIGGITGSMDTLEQQLRSRLGFLEMADATTLFQRRFDNLIDGMAPAEVTFDNLGRAVQSTERVFTGDSIPQFRAAIISMLDSGIDASRVIAGPLSEALQTGEIRWTEFVEAMGRFKVAIPFMEAGEFNAQLLNMGTATFKAKQQVATLLELAADTPGIDPRLWREFNTQLGAFATGGATIEEVWGAIGENIMPQISDRIAGLNTNLKTSEIRALAAAIATEDWTAALRVLDGVEERMEERRREREGLPGVDIQKARAELNEMLTLSQRFGDEWGELLAQPKGIFDPGTLALVASTIEKIPFEDLTKAQQTRIQVAVESGKATRIINTLLSILNKVEKPRTTPVDADIRKAQQGLATAQREGTRWEQSTFTADVNADTSQAHAAMSHFIETWNGRTVNVQVGVTTPSELGGIAHTGGFTTPFGVFHAGGEVPAILQTGEYVFSRDAVRRIGRQALDAMNSGGSGGAIQHSDEPMKIRGEMTIKDWRRGIAKLDGEMAWKDWQDGR